MRRLPIVLFIFLSAIFGFGLTLGILLGSLWQCKQQSCSPQATPPPESAEDPIQA
ncbi:MAG: hypothetical protein NW237_06995 [Cyanobacteriota bacterium]|nr:hypothetical protein [Cyanobacteriota bacterium]